MSGYFILFSIGMAVSFNCAFLFPFSLVVGQRHFFSMSTSRTCFIRKVSLLL